MDLLEVMRQRRGVRQYTGERIADEDMQVLKAWLKLAAKAGSVERFENDM